MKKIYAFFVFLLSLQMGSGQEPVAILYTGIEPVIDGIEEELWDLVDPVAIEKDFTGESPSLTAYWKALWDSAHFYVLLSVEDDDHYPSWESGGNWYEYDQPEIYFDLNAELKDGLGANDAQGHWQVQPGFTEDGSGVPVTLSSTDKVFRPLCTYCYVVTGENYVWEYQFLYEDFTNKTGEVLSLEAFRALDPIGFDVTIIDQDENVTDSRQRAVWSNAGDTDENYLNMDDAGTIVMVDRVVSSQQYETHTFAVYPNPVADYLNISMDFDRIRIVNTLGQIVWTSENSTKRVNLGMIPEGIYFIGIFKDNRSIGYSKIIKE